MRSYSFFSTTVIVSTACSVFALAGCGSGGSVLGPIGSFGPSGNSAQVRFVNGSPDAGPVQISLDNQQQFCTGGTGGGGCSIPYGTVTGYAVNLSAGNHAVILRDQNGNQIAVSAGSISVNNGFKYTIALVGEVHPSGSGTPLNLVTIQEQPFSTPGGGAAVNFNDASPAQTKALGGAVQFGYTVAGSSTMIASPIGVGSETNPSRGGLPSTALNTPITFFAGSATNGVTVTPSQVDSKNCSSNSLPCAGNEMNFSLYLIDGPAASTSPAAAPYPSGATATSTGVFVGAFDPNG